MFEKTSEGLRAPRDSKEMAGAMMLLGLCLLLVPHASWGGVGKVAGVVTDKDGEPIAGVQVTVRSEDGSVRIEDETNKRGKFSISLKEPEKSYVIRFACEGYDTFEGPIEIREGQTNQGTWPLLSAEEGAELRAEMAAIDAHNKAARLYNDGVKLYNENDLAGAARQFQAAIEEDSGLAIPWAGLAQIYLDGQQYSEAAEAMEHFLEYLEATNEARGAALRMLYQAYNGMGASTKADAVLADLVTSYPSRETAVHVFGQGVEAARANDLAKAKERFEISLEMAPDLYQAHINLAHINGALGEWDQALKEVDAFLAQEPAHIGALALKYQALDELGLEQEAAATLTALQSASPAEAAEIFHDRGVRLFNGGELESAVQTFRRVLEIQPEHPHTHYMMGLCLASSGDDDQAKGFLQRFLELAPDDPDAPAAREMLAYL